MKRQKFQRAAAVVMWCVGAFTARAQFYGILPPGTGPYCWLGLGPSFFEDGRLTKLGAPAGAAVKFAPGLAADAALGYAFNPHVSAGAEIGFLGAKMDSVSGYFSRDSHLNQVPFLLNATLSLPLLHARLIPSFGAGGGFAVAEFNTGDLSDALNLVVVSGRETDVVPAGQLFAELRFRLTPESSLGLRYQFLVTGDPSFSFPPSNVPVGFRGVWTHSVLFTFEWKF